MDEIRVFGYCKNCDNEITDEYDEYYINAEGEVFCCEECMMEYYGVVKIEV